MAKAKSAIPPLSAYERIGMRIQKLIADPRVQKTQAVTVCRRDDEPEEDWQRFIEDIQSTDGVTVSTSEDGLLRIGWKAYIDA